MVPCEFRCWGEYLSWQFTIGLCAALARSRNERPDTFACFLWPAQYLMGRAYSLQKLNGRVVASGFAVGKTGFGKPPARCGTSCSIDVKMPTGITATTVSVLSGRGRYGAL